MYECPLCNFNAPTRSLWLSHLRSVHHDDNNFLVTCGIDGCTSTYSRCTSFVSHIYRQHREVVIVKNSAKGVGTFNTDLTEVEEDVSYGTNAFDMLGEREERTDLQHAVDQLTQKDEEEQLKKDALFILNLKEICCLSESSIDRVVKQAQKVFRHTFGRIRAGVNEHIASYGIDPSDIPNLSEFFSSVEQPFQGLQSTYLQENFYRQQFKCIVSYSYPIEPTFVHLFHLHRILSPSKLVQPLMEHSSLEASVKRS